MVFTSHICGEPLIVLFSVPMVHEPRRTMFWVKLFLNMCFYMPTISLAITVAYTALKGEGLSVVKDYPGLLGFGVLIGFIAALWTVSLFGFETTANQFYVASGASLFLGLYAFTLPKCPPQLDHLPTSSLVEALGLHSFRLFKIRKMALFFIFAMLLGAALQLHGMPTAIRTCMTLLK